MYMGAVAGSGIYTGASSLDLFAYILVLCSHYTHAGLMRMVIYLQEGLIALWKGWLPSVIGVIPYVGLNFAVYETLKDVVLKFYGEPYLFGGASLACTHANGAMAAGPEGWATCSMCRLHA